MNEFYLVIGIMLSVFGYSKGECINSFWFLEVYGLVGDLKLNKEVNYYSFVINVIIKVWIKFYRYSVFNFIWEG